MAHLQGRTVLITGAGKGIGRACAEIFARAGARLVLFSRSGTDLIQVSDTLKSQGADVYHEIVDVRERDRVEGVLSSMPLRWQSIDILVNNAGLALGLEPLQEGGIEDWDTMIDTNIKGLLYITRAIIPGMIERGRGHIINIGSTAAIHAYPGGNVYCATKAAVHTLSDGLRQDLVSTPLRVTNIQPGMVDTNFSPTRFHGDQARAAAVYQGIQPLSAEDVADAVLYAASTPDHVQICEITLTPTHQATGGVVYRDKD